MRVDRDLLSLALGTAALITAEVFLGGLANYVLSDEINLYLPVLVFGGVALGSVLGLAAPVARLPLAWLILGVGACTLAGLVGLARLDALGPLWVLLPITGFGMYLCKVLGEVPLRTVVWALGLGGGLLYLALNAILTLPGPQLVLILVSLVLAAAIAKETSGPVAFGAALLFFGTVVGLETRLLEPTSYLERNTPGLIGAPRIRPPIQTPLIRTDVYETREGRVVMTTNGSRLAVLPERGYVERVLAAGRSPWITYEAPYAVVEPKQVLVIGSAEGENVLAALAHDVERVVAVDINPAVFEVMKGELGAARGGVYLDPRVESVVSEGRRYAEIGAERFDLITLQGVQTGSKNDLRHGALLESYLFTEEALRSFWRRVGDDGVLYFDEYRRTIAGSDSGESLVGLLGSMAPGALGLTEPDRQCLLFWYVQGLDNPRADGAIREGVLISRRPLDDAKMAGAVARLAELGGVHVPGGCSRPVDPALHISDDRPFFMQMLLAARARAVPGWAVGGVLVLLLGLLRAWSRRRAGATRAERTALLSLFATGIGYVTFVLAITGPATLLLGDPQAATPVVFVSMYVWGLCGGLVALEIDAARARLGLVALVVYLGLCGLLLPALSSLVLPLESVTLRAIIVAALILPAALLAEVPYVYLLRQLEGRRRGLGYVAENLGTVAGIPLGFLFQVNHGFTSCLWLAGGAYICTLLVFEGGRRE